MTPDPVMPKALQIESLKRIFKGLNPEVGVDMVDWEGLVSEGYSFDQNRTELAAKKETNIYKWYADKEEERISKKQAKKDLEDKLDYMLSAVQPEALEDFKKTFEAYVSDYSYRLERDLEKGKLLRTVKALEKEITSKPKPSEQKEIARKEMQEQERTKVRMTDDLKTRLKRLFEATYTKETGKSPSKFLPEFWVELDLQISQLPSEEEMKAAVIDLALEIVGREEARERLKKKELERPPPEKPPKEAIVGLPPEEEEEFFITAPPAELPTYPEKPFIPSRRLTGTEIEDIEDAFNYELAKCGKRPERFTKEFDDWIREELFGSWDHVKNNFKTLVEMICTEKTFAKPPRALPYEEVLPLVQWQASLKIEKPEDWMIPWKQKPPKNNTIEDVIASLEEVGKPGVTRGDVVRAVKEGWEKKIPSFINIDKEYLEKLIGEPLG